MSTEWQTKNREDFRFRSVLTDFPRCCFLFKKNPLWEKLPLSLLLSCGTSLGRCDSCSKLIRGHISAFSALVRFRQTDWSSKIKIEDLSSSAFRYYGDLLKGGDGMLLDVFAPQKQMDRMSAHTITQQARSTVVNSAE